MAFYKLCAHIVFSDMGLESQKMSTAVLFIENCHLLPLLKDIVEL